MANKTLILSDPELKTIFKALLFMRGYDLILDNVMTKHYAIPIKVAEKIKERAYPHTKKIKLKGIGYSGTAVKVDPVNLKRILKNFEMQDNDLK